MADFSSIDHPSDDVDEAQPPYKSSISILPSSMPAYHRAYMAQREAGRAGTSVAGHVRDETKGVELTSATRSLRPHGRKSSCSDQSESKPERLSPMPAKRARQTKWQFGIRSRNPPLDAMYCIYRALKRLGAEWEEPELDPLSDDGTADGGNDEVEPGFSAGARDHILDKKRNQGNGRARASDKATSAALTKRDVVNDEDGDVDPDEPYMPRDPWLIRCRWLKKGLAEASGGPSSTGQSGTTHPASPDPERRDGDGTATATAVPTQTDRLYVYMEIQLYQIEPEFYLVDFKCAGYQRLLDEIVGDDDHADKDVDDDDDDAVATGGAVKDVGPSSTRTKTFDLERFKARHDLRTPEGNEAGVRHLRRIQQKLKQARGLRRQLEPEEKVSSPFPFLDLASQLIIALADGE